MSNKTTAEIEHKLTVDNAEAVKKVEAQAAAYKKLADAQKQADARERSGTTGMDADTVRLLRMARGDKAAGRYTDMASQGFSNEDMMRRYRAERNLVMPEAQKREMERTQAMLAGGGAGGKSGGGALAAILKGGAIGAGVGAAAETGASLAQDYYQGQKAFGLAMKDATRETIEGLPLVGGFVKSMRRFGEQLLYGREMADTAASIKMYERGGQLASNRLEREDRLRPYQLDSSAASARARAAFEQNINFMVGRNSLNPKDPRILAGEMGLAENQINLAGAQQTQADLSGQLSSTDERIRTLKQREQQLIGERPKEGFWGRNAKVEAENAAKTKEVQEQLQKLYERRTSLEAQSGEARKNVIGIVYKTEMDILNFRKQALDIAKEETKQYKDKALTFDQMDPEQQFQLAMDFDRAKAGGIGSMSAEEKRRILGSGLAGKDLIEQAQNAATQNPLLQGILAGQGGKTLEQLRAKEVEEEGLLNRAAPNGVEARAKELRGEMESKLKVLLDSIIEPMFKAIDESQKYTVSKVASESKKQDAMKREYE